MFKFIGSIFIIFSFSFAGLQISYHQKKRCNNLLKLIRLTKYVYSEAAFTKKRAYLILNEAATLYNLDFLVDVCKKMKYKWDITFKIP